MDEKTRLLYEINTFALGLPGRVVSSLHAWSLYIHAKQHPLMELGRCNSTWRLACRDRCSGGPQRSTNDPVQNPLYVRAPRKAARHEHQESTRGETTALANLALCVRERSRYLPGLLYILTLHAERTEVYKYGAGSRLSCRTHRDCNFLFFPTFQLLYILFPHLLRIFPSIHGDLHRELF